jgi:tripartite-type tricarboxylate transporter receptor subunit TctC
MQAKRTTTAGALIAACLFIFMATAACAQNYPDKAVRIITGGVGTFHDIVTRQLALRLSERWGQPVVVENQGAASRPLALCSQLTSPTKKLTCLGNSQ